MLSRHKIKRNCRGGPAAEKNEKSKCQEQAQKKDGTKVIVDNAQQTVRNAKAGEL